MRVIEDSVYEFERQFHQYNTFIAEVSAQVKELGREQKVATHSHKELKNAFSYCISEVAEQQVDEVENLYRPQKFRAVCDELVALSLQKDSLERMRALNDALEILIKDLFPAKMDRGEAINIAMFTDNLRKDLTVINKNARATIKESEKSQVSLREQRNRVVTAIRGKAASAKVSPKSNPKAGSSSGTNMNQGDDKTGPSAQQEKNRKKKTKRKEKTRRRDSKDLAAILGDSLQLESPQVTATDGSKPKPAQTNPSTASAEVPIAASSPRAVENESSKDSNLGTSSAVVADSNLANAAGYARTPDKVLVTKKSDVIEFGARVSNSQKPKAGARKRFD